MELLRPEHKTKLEIVQEVVARSHYHSEARGENEGRVGLVQGKSPWSKPDLYPAL